MSILLDIAAPIFFLIPTLVVVLVIAAIGVGIFFLVRAIIKKNAHNGSNK